MRRPKIGLALAIVLFELVACNNGGGPGGNTGGAGGAGGTTSAGGAMSSAGTTTSAAGTTSASGGASGGSTSAAGTTSTSVSSSGGATSAGGSTGTGGSTNAAGTTGTGGSTSSAGSTSAAGATSASGGTTGGTTGASSSTAGAGMTSTSGGATAGSRTDAGTDAAAGADGSPDAGRDASAAREVPSDTSLRPDAAPDSASDAIASSCTCLGKPAPVCTPTGHLSYTLSRAAAPTADQADAYNQITCAMDMAVAYYNCYANITGSVRVSYDTGVATADGNINGSIRFGAGRQYMLCATAMHEIAHTQGIGTASQWAAHVSGGLFVGTNTAAQLQAINATLSKPLDTVIHADSMHFWPYGLNYETEATGTDILIDHCEMVVAIRKDLGLQP